MEMSEIRELSGKPMYFNVYLTGKYMENPGMIRRIIMGKVKR